MGMRGPAPKPPDQHANPNTVAAERARMRVVKSATVPAPDLPEFLPNGEEWPPHTLHWWDCWVNDPLTDDYRMSDWLDLIDCAVLHAAFWTGDIKAAAELRLRMDKHGATKEARAKLRISYAMQDITEVKADEAKKRAAKVVTEPSARERRAGMKVVMPNFSAAPDADEPGF